MRIAITGGLGFIGSALTRHLAPDFEVSVVDARTYAADERRVAEYSGHIRIQQMDVSSPDFLPWSEATRPDVIAHLAAETHVTRSENDPELFFHSNVIGTRNVIEAALRADALLLHVSTDEVYGPIAHGAFNEQDKIGGGKRASSPYAKSKAVADDLAETAMERQRVVIARPTNCYGPWQHPEKAVARWIIRALRGKRLPVWGDGRQIRDWMYVDDVCSALKMLMVHGPAGETFNVAPEGPEATNLEVARLIAELCSRKESSVELTAYDRPDHDRRYRVSAARLRAMGWAPRWDLRSGMAKTVDWYRQNLEWAESHLDRAEAIYDDSSPAV